MKKIIKLLDQNILFILTCLLLTFIILYPKLPLADVLPGYLVKIRLEDIFVLVVTLVFAVQFLRRKVKNLNNSFIYLIIFYALMGFLSVLSGVFLLQRIPFQLLHIGKSLLHLFRYLEYFMLFIIAFAALKKVKDLKFIYLLLPLIVILIGFYGLGQKYLHFPVFSTMNREYSKGVALTLGEGARVNSTFGGHYDMSAFLVIVLPILLALTVKSKKIILKLFFIFAQISGLCLLFLGESKTAIISLLLAYLILLYFLFKNKIVKKILSINVLFFALLALIFTFGGPIRDKMVLLAEQIPGVIKITTKLNLHPSMTDKPTDLTYAGPEYERITIINEDGSESYAWQKKGQSWSANALKYGISMGIRLDTLWPQATRGLIKNIFLGSSYATLNKGENAQFTEADSTDNNYLRVLGETGLLGFISFYGLILLVIYTNFRNLKYNFVFSAALIAASCGLLFNAIYIDVFAASKVAFTFWLLMGLSIKSFYLQNLKLAQKLDLARFNLIKNFVKNNYLLILFLIIFSFLVYRNPYLEEKSLIIKLNPHYSSTWRTLAKLQNIPLIFKNKYSFYFVNLILAYLSLVLFYILIKKSNKKLVLALLAFVTLSPALRVLIFQPNYLIFLVPMILIIYLLNKKQIKIKLNKYILYVVSILLVMAWVLDIASHPDFFFKDFRQNIPSTWHYRTMFRANIIMPDPDNRSPILISQISPNFAQFFKKDDYQILNFEPNNLENLVTKNLEVILTNYDFSKEQELAFKDLRKKFTTQVLELDCEENCNFYKLKPWVKLKQYIQPITYYNDLKIEEKNNFSFFYVGHSYQTKLSQPSRKLYYSFHLAQKLKELANYSADFLLLSGDLSIVFSSDRFSYLDKYAFKVLNLPVINVKNQHHPNLLHPDYQSFKINNNYFLVLDTGQAGQLDRYQLKFIYNKLLEVEREQEIKNLFIFTYRSHWLKEEKNQNDLDFYSKVLPKLQELDKNLNIYIIAGDQGEHEYPEIIESQEDNIHYLSTGFGRTVKTELLKIEVKNDEVQIKKINL